LTTNYQGIYSASINGSTTIEISEDTGLVLLGSTVSTLNIGAYAYLPGQDPFRGASCAASAEASIPWLTRNDCFNNTVHFIPRAGGKASITNGPIDGVTLECYPGITGTSFSADASSGPATSYISFQREDGYNLVYTGTPISVESGKPQVYTIDLGFVGQIKAFLQNFSISINPPDVAKVQYSFVFAGII